jgi:hypothetical protein
MMKNAFAGHENRPTESELLPALGKAHSLWKGLVTDLKRDLKLDAEEWNSSSIKAGWSLRLQRKKRNIVYLLPSTSCFLASFALGDKALAAARIAKLPPSTHKLIDEAKRYAEGTAVRIEVHDPKDVDIVKTLAKIKLEN